MKEFNYSKAALLGHMRAAEAYASASHAVRLKVGAVVVNASTKQPVGVGWNGMPAGQDNCCEIKTPDANAVSGYSLQTDPKVVHAEINAFKNIYFTRDTYDLFVTDSPCEECAAYIIGLKAVKRVFFRRLYRVDTGIRMLIAKGIEVYQINENDDVIQLTLSTPTIETQKVL